jgi:chemotaxis protein methyltransferase CheR
MSSDRAENAEAPEIAVAPEFEFTDRDFNYLRELVGRHAGIALADTKRQLVYGRLSRRLRALRLRSFADYCAYVEAQPEAELGNLINAITTNLTAFFRERHHFAVLDQRLLPALATARAATRRLRLWSAGCSTGAEPYSIAMTAGECAAVRGWEVRILATDIDTNVLETASRGVYGEKDVEGLSAAQRQRWFLRGKGANAAQVKVKPELRAMVEFRPLNLIKPWPMKGPFDAIFCRNVVIYFDKPTQRQLFDRMADLLADDGLLFIGHSESLFKVCDRFEPAGPTVYRKRA